MGPNLEVALFRATKVPGGWNSNMLCGRGPCVAYFSLGLLGLKGPGWCGNNKILAFADGVEFGSRLFWSYKGPRKLEFGYVLQKWRLLWSNEFWGPSFEEAPIKKQHWDSCPSIWGWTRKLLYLEIPKSEQAEIWICCASEEHALFIWIWGS